MKFLLTMPTKLLQKMLNMNYYLSDTHMIMHFFMLNTTSPLKVLTVCNGSEAPIFNVCLKAILLCKNCTYSALKVFVVYVYVAQKVKVACRALKEGI